MPTPRLALAATLFAALLAAPVAAQQAAAPSAAPNAAPNAAPLSACAPRAAVVAQLERKYGETRRGAGLQNRGAVTEVFASATTGTWTIIVTRPDGLSCAVAAGEAWLEETALSAAPPA